MTKYKVTKMNLGFGDVEYSVAREDEYTKELYPVVPIRYYKTQKGALKRIMELLK